MKIPDRIVPNFPVWACYVQSEAAVNPDGMLLIASRPTYQSLFGSIRTESADWAGVKYYIYDLKGNLRGFFASGIWYRKGAKHGKR